VDGLNEAGKFAFEAVETVDGKRCARIAWTEEATSKEAKESMQGTYWLGIDEGYIVKASLSVGRSNALKGTVKPLAKFSVEVTTRVP